MKLVDLTQHTNNMSDKRDAGLTNAMLTPVFGSLESRAMNTCGLTYGSTAPEKLKIANATLASAEGIAVLVAAATEIAFTATEHDVPVSNTRIFAATVDKAGDTYIRAGVAGTSLAAATFPVIPKGEAPLGLCTIAVTDTAFTAGTTQLSAATLTDSYYDCLGPFATTK